MGTLNQILDLSKIESNKLDINLEDLDIESEINNIIKLYSITAKNKHIFLKVKNISEVKPLVARLDDRMFFCVIDNLLNNAMKYTLEGGVTVELSTELIDSVKMAVINVRDTGIGIDRKHLDLIFDEFRQVSEGKGRFYEGTGLGLTITKRFTQLMNGDIKVKSTLGKGSVFSVYYPLVPKSPDTPGSKKSISGKSKPERKVGSEDKVNQVQDKEILYIEDDFLSQEVVKIFLKGIIKIDIASTAQIALQMLGNRIYDLILLDINLGRDISGLDVLDKIKEMPEYENIPIIAITAYAMKGDKEELLSAGCTDYLAKPFERKNLVEIILKALN